MFNRLIKNAILKNVVTLISGTIIAYILQILFQLILRRIYSVEDMGLFDLYVSFVSIWIIISTLRYEFAIVQPDKDSDASNIVIGIGFIAFIISVISLILIVLFPAFFSNILDFPKEKYHWLYFLPLSTFIFAFYQGVNYWLIRNKNFRASSINKISRRATEGIFQSIFGYAGKSIGLVIGDIAGNTANVLSGIFQMKKSGFKFNDINITSIKKMMVNYANFPKLQAFPALINTFSLFLPLLIINRYYDAETLGYFGLSRNMLLLPVALVSMSVSQVLLRDFAEKRKQRKKITPTFLNTSLILLIIFIPVVLIVVFAGPWLFGFVFSQKYEISGIYSQILVFAVLFQFVVSPVSIFFTAFEKLKISALWQLGYFILTCSLFAFKDLDVEKFIMIFTAINIVSYFIYWLLILYMTRKNDMNLTEAQA
ncbi:MAG: hypothetical protein Kow0068_10640 [Marinilabiliales bacterium]